MPLCGFCSKLSPPGTGLTRTAHQPSFIALQLSSQQCCLCKAFLEIFLTTGKTRIGIIQDAELRAASGETTHLSIVIPEEQSSRNRFSPAGSLSDLSFSLGDWRDSRVPVQGNNELAYMQLEVSCRDRVWTSEPLVFAKTSSRLRRSICPS
jgi:hypothetical protein